MDLQILKLSDLNILAVGNTIQMAGAVYSDADKTYLVMFPDEHDAIGKPTVLLNLSPTDWQTFLQQTDHLEVEMLAPDQDGKMVKAIVRKSQRQIDQGVSWTVYKRDGFRCRYCGQEAGVGGMALTVDHLVLWEDGGPSIPENLVAACRKCNKSRGNMKYDDWLKSDYYRKISRNLIGFAADQNEKVADKLHLIPRQKVRSR